MKPLFHASKTASPTATRALIAPAATAISSLEVRVDAAEAVTLPVVIDWVDEWAATKLSPRSHRRALNALTREVFAAAQASDDRAA
jgi:hypothetical protein